MREASKNQFQTGTVVRAAIAAAMLAIACALGGCASGTARRTTPLRWPEPVAAQLWPSSSIDGPPPQVFDRMVGVLDSESKLRNLSIVSREGGAAYRVRSYLSAQMVRGRTMISWVWDVYDGNQQRALRLSGEEPAGKAGRDAWAAADDLILRKIAQSRPERPQQHDQRRTSRRHGACPGTKPPRPSGGERRTS